MRRRLDDSAMSAWALEQLRRNDPAVILQAGSALGAFDSRAWLGDVNVPTAVVVTAMDRVVSPRSQMALADSIPGATVYSVQADHAGCLMAPDKFVPALFEACRDVAVRAAARR